MPRQSTVIGFWKCCLYSFIHKSAAVRFFECAANSAGGERLRREGETSRSWGETGDIILLNESLRFIQNVASCYALCLTKESVNTATLVHAPACVCVRVCVCVPRTEVWVIQVRLKYEVVAGPDLIPSRSGVRTLRSTGLYRYQHVEVDSSLFVSERMCGVRCRKLRHYSIITFLLSLSVCSELTEIKTFTGINLAQSLHVCKPWCKRVLVWYPLARLHGLKQKYFQHCDVTNCPTPPYRKHTEPWHHCVVSNRTVNFVNRPTT